MPQGLQVFNAAGQAVLDTSNRVLKSFVVQAVTETGSPTISASGVNSTSTILAVPLAAEKDAPPPSISVAGTTVTVTWGSDARGSSFSRDILVMEY